MERRTNLASLETQFRDGEWLGHLFSEGDEVWVAYELSVDLKDTDREWNHQDRSDFFKRLSIDLHEMDIEYDPFDFLALDCFEAIQEDLVVECHRRNIPLTCAVVTGFSHGSFDVNFIGILKGVKLGVDVIKVIVDIAKIASGILQKRLNKKYGDRFNVDCHELDYGCRSSSLQRSTQSISKDHVDGENSIVDRSFFAPSSLIAFIALMLMQAVILVAIIVLIVAVK